MTRRPGQSRLSLEKLESRNLLAVAINDVFELPADRPLNVGALETGFSGSELVQAQTIASPGGVTQIEYSPEFSLVFTRNSGTAIRVIDTRTRITINTQLANGTFTDIDLSPDGRYLFAADYSTSSHYVHRYDSLLKTWEVKASANIAYRLEAVDDRRIILDSSLNDFGALPSDPLVELDRVGSGYRGEMAYDFRTRRLYIGNSGSSSHEIGVDELIGEAFVDDELVRRGNTGTYGTAQGHGGSVALSSDGERFYYGRLQVESWNIRNNLNVFPEAIRAATPWLAFGTNNYYDVLTGDLRGSLGFSTGVYFVSNDGAHVWAFNDDTDTLHHYVPTQTRIGVLFNDQGEGELSTTVALDVEHGELTLHPDGSFLYVPEPGFVGVDSFSYNLHSATEEDAIGTVALVVYATNAAPSPYNDDYSIVAGTPLTIGEEISYDLPELVQLTTFRSPGDVNQIIFSPQFNLLFLRTESLIRILDVRTETEIAQLRASERFTDMDLTADEGHLFVADYGETRTGYGTPVRTHAVHRFDLAARTWESKTAPSIAYRIEAIDSQRFIILEADQHVDVLLNDFGETAVDPIVQITKAGMGYSGDIEFDPDTGRLYHGNIGLSSQEISVRAVAGDVLGPATGTGTYGTAQGYGGSLVLSGDAQTLYYGSLQVDALDIRNNLNVFPEAIRAASSKLAFGTRAYYDARTADARGRLGYDATVFFVSPDEEHVWTFEPDTDLLRHYRIVDATRLGLLANDRDADGDTLTAHLVTEPLHGSVTLHENGTFTYIPDAGFVGIDTFSYAARDEQEASSIGQVTINVTPPPPGSNQSPLAVDDEYTTAMGVPLVVGIQPWREVASHNVGTIDTQQNVKQIEYSPQFGIVVARADDIHVYDATTGALLSRQSPLERFTDMDLTYDGRYLFAADYGGTNIGYGSPSKPHYVHRFDLVTGAWDVQHMPRIAYQIEAVSRNRVLLKEIDQHVDITHNEFLDWHNAPMKELSRMGANYIGDFEYDPRTQRIFHGSTGSSSHEIHSYRLVNDQLVDSTNTNTYGSAQGYQGGSVLSSDGLRFYYGRLQVEALDVRNNLRVFPEPIRAASGQVAFGKTAYYDARTGATLGNAGFQSEVWFVSDDGQHAWAADPTGRLHHFDLTTITSGVLLNDTDPDGDPLQVTLTATPLHGTLSMDPSGAFRYVPEAGFVGVDEFAYMVEDGRGGSAFGTITVNVIENTPPTDIQLPVEVVKEGVMQAPVSQILVSDADGMSVHSFETSDERFEVKDGMLQLKLDVYLHHLSEQSINLTITATDQFGASITKSFVIFVIANPKPWQNLDNVMDVSGDDLVTPLDAVLIIIDLNANGPRTLAEVPVAGPNFHYLDTSGDGEMTPLDAILVINVLNTPPTEGESEPLSNIAGTVPELEVAGDQAQASAYPASLPPDAFSTPHDKIWSDFSLYFATMFGEKPFVTNLGDDVTPKSLSWWRNFSARPTNAEYLFAKYDGSKHFIDLDE